MFSIGVQFIWSHCSSIHCLLQWKLILYSILSHIVVLPPKFPLCMQGLKEKIPSFVTMGIARLVLSHSQAIFQISEQTSMPLNTNKKGKQQLRFKRENHKLRKFKVHRLFQWILHIPRIWNGIWFLKRQKTVQDFIKIVFLRRENLRNHCMKNSVWLWVLVYFTKKNRLSLNNTQLNN